MPPSNVYQLEKGGETVKWLPLVVELKVQVLGDPLDRIDQLILAKHLHQRLAGTIGEFCTKYGYSLVTRESTSIQESYGTQTQRIVSLLPGQGYPRAPRRSESELSEGPAQLG